MEHIPLTLFSICLQAAIGIMAFVAIGRLLNKDGVFRNALITAAGLGVVGMLVTLLHLGRPFRAYLALNQFASSWLSREIWLSGLFVGLAVLAVLLIFIRPQNRNIVNGTVVVASIVGLINIAVMANIYSSSSVPLWQGSTTIIEFYAATITMGAIIFLFLSLQEANKMKKLLASVVASAVIIQVAAVITNLIHMGSSFDYALQGSLVIMSSMIVVNILKWLFILAGAALMLWIVKEELSTTVTNTVLASALLLFAGQLIGRYLFYVTLVNGIGIY